MSRIVSRYIKGVSPSPESRVMLNQMFSLRPEQEMVFCVFEVQCHGSTYYCCWSGGRIENGRPMMTLTGKAAMEALCSVKAEGDDQLHIHELRVGLTPLREKVMTILRAKPAHARVCFLGDLNGELDGLMAKAFNVTGESVNLSKPLH